MVTLVIQLSSGPWTWQEATEQTVKEFPGEIALFSSDPAEGVRLKLNQERLNDEQRDWLQLSMFAMQHIESYHLERTSQQLRITPELLYEAHHIVSPGEWAKGQPPMSETERVKFTIMADWLNEQLKTAEKHDKLSDVPLRDYLMS